MASYKIGESLAGERDLSVQQEYDLNASSKMLGLSLVDQGKIKPHDIEKILGYSQERGLRFGEAAVKLRLISREDLDEAVAAQFNYPYLGKGAHGLSKELVAAFQPFSVKGEALRTLRSQLLLRWFSEGKKTLAVTAPHRCAGSSYITANLAVIWSQMGERTLLVDADLRGGRQHSLFGVKNEIGLSGALAGRATLDSVIKPLAPFRGLSLLPAGAPPPNPGELFERNEFASIMDRLRDEYSVILFDTPPMNSGGGADYVAACCEGALLVLRKNRTQLSVASTLIEKIRSHDAEIVGSVMTIF
ncbi:MAG: polysaccharide biosynthesis tyrosine autokinase [Candidatus Promineifilaceae bacterium]